MNAPPPYLVGKDVEFVVVHPVRLGVGAANAKLRKAQAGPWESLVSWGGILMRHRS